MGIEEECMKIGLSAFAWTAEIRPSHLELLPELKRLGVRGVELPMFDPRRLPVERVRRAFEENGLECTVCAILPPGINPISPDEATRRKSIDHLKACVFTAGEMGAGLLGGPLFAPIGDLPEHRPTADEWEWAVEAFRSLEEGLEATNMVLSLEPVNRSETFFVRTGAEAARLCEAIGNPRIGVTIDTFHANIEERDLCAALRSLGHHLRHVHVSENDRGPLGRGHIPFAEIVATLEDMGYGGYLMIEGFGYLRDERNSPGFLWAHADVSPEAFASESLDYLKGLLAR